MMRIKTALLLFLTLFSFEIMCAPCRCEIPGLNGTIQDVYSYNTDGPGCCSSPANNFLAEHSFERLNEGVWETVTVDPIDPNAAQSKCCDII